MVGLGSASFRLLRTAKASDMVLPPEVVSRGQSPFVGGLVGGVRRVVVGGDVAGPVKVAVSLAVDPVERGASPAAAVGAGGFVHAAVAELRLSSGYTCGQDDGCEYDDSGDNDA